MEKFYPLKFYLFLFVLALPGFLFAQNPSQDGEWSDPIGFGMVPVAVANLPDGRLIAWSSKFRDTFTETGDGMTWTEIFDPSTDTALGATLANTDHDMFCPGINNLPDGRILSAGGTSSTRTSIYDVNTGLWSVADEMNIPRGYQGNVTLSDGSVFTVGGSWADGDSPTTNGNKDAEIWTEATGWLNLAGISGDDIYTSNDLSKELQGIYRVDNHVWLWPAPNGYLFHAGPSEMMHWMDVSGGGSMVDAGLRGSDTYSIKGTTVMFDTGRILKVGGAESYGGSDPAFVPAKDNSYVIDLNGVAFGGTPTVTATANNLSFSRTMHNSTVLPTGEVLVTGGLDRAEVFSDIGARLTAELYDPATNSWRNVAGMQIPRTYHSVAILLLDGRVFVGGGGLCDTSNLDECVNHMDAEIYSPPYLFNPDGSLATRPSISAPATADYNTNISVTGDSGIDEFVLIRFSAATHSTNNEQRRIPLSFTGNGTYSVSIPDRNLLPPGYYMLFGLDNGVPSVAESIQVGNALPLSYDPTLVLDLQFDESSGVDVSDSSVYGNNGTILERDDSGNPTVADDHSWSAGLFGGALELDGLEHTSNSIVDVPFSSSLATIDDQITVSAWVWRDSGSVIPQTGRVANVAVLSHDYPAIFFGFHNTLYKWSFGTQFGFVDCYAGYAPLDGWVHLAASYDGQTARLYANGVEICNKAITGDITLRNDGSDYSSFTASGFYDDRTMPVVPYGNSSAVTDELDGRIDELKVFNRVLDAGEINALFALGQATGDPTVANCPAGTIVAEYRIGSTGPWIEGNNINASEGEEVYIRAKNYSGEYYVTTPQVDGPTFSSVADLPGHNADAAYQIDTFVNPFGNPERNNGLVDQSNIGQFVLTTPEGCATVINLNVAGNCDPGDTPIIPEYQLNGVWDSGETAITVDEGTNVILSALPNTFPGGGQIGITITLTDGTVVNDNHNLGPVNKTDHEGTYIMTSEEGCTATLTLTVNEVDCGALGLVTEYQINSDPFVSGATELTMDEGNRLALSILPNGILYSIAGPNGNNKPESTTDLVIDSVVPADSGLYTFTTSSGCQVTLDLTVNVVDCGALGLETEYQINSDPFVSGASELTVDEGNRLALSIFPNGILYSIAGPNGNNKPLSTTDLVIDTLVPADSGLYTFTTVNGCEVTLDVTVNAVDCGALGLLTEYQINSDPFVSGATEVTLDEGNRLALSILPNGLPYSISGPNGNNKPFSSTDLVIDTVVPADSGLYTFTTGSGCEVTLDVTINTVDCGALGLVTEYQINSDPFVNGATEVTLDEGNRLALSILPNGLPYSIAGPNGNNKPISSTDLVIDTVVPADSGLYTFTTGSGCQVTLDVTVNAVDCGALGLVTEYQINDEDYVSGASDVTLFEGSRLTLSILPNGLPYSISGPNGNNKSLSSTDLVIDSVTPADSGLYTFTTGAGCEVTLDVTVEVVDCDSFGLVTEYQINTDPFVSGATELTVDPGNRLVLSILPNGVLYSIAGPNGNNKPEGSFDLVIESLVPEDSGTYTFTTNLGCQVTLELTVPVDCDTFGLLTEYSINGGPSVSGQSALTITEFDSVSLGIIPDGIAFSVSGPNGNNKGLDINDLLIGSATLADSGTYTFTTVDGCSVTLELSVESFDCGTLGLMTEYSLNGNTPISGQLAVNISEGDNISLGIIPDGIAFSINGPNGNNKGLDNSDLQINNATLADSGIYTFTTATGCSVSLELTVEPLDCTALGIMTEYSVNGNTPISGQAVVNISEGDDITLGIIPDDIAFSIDGPNGNNKGLDTNKLQIVDASPADSGIYVFSTEQGCEILLDLNVEPASCEALNLAIAYAINDGNQMSGQSQIIVTEGDDITLALLPAGTQFSVNGPNGNNKDLNTEELLIANAVEADGGTYTFTSEEGCILQISLIVEPRETQSSINDVIIYPNPATDNIVNITLDGFMDEMILVSIHDIYGKLIFQELINIDHDPVYPLNISNLSNGTYIIYIERTKEDQSTYRKLIKI